MKTKIIQKSSRCNVRNEQGTRNKFWKKAFKSTEKHELPDEYTQTLRTVIILIACAFITVLLF